MDRRAHTYQNTAGKVTRDRIKTGSNTAEVHIRTRLQTVSKAMLLTF